MGWKQPSNKTKISGTPIVEELKLTTGTDCYAGRLVAKGAADEYGVVGTAILPPVGFISYEHTHPQYQPATYATAFAASDIAGIISGPIVAKGRLAAGVSCVKGDKLANWAGGDLVPVAEMQGGLAVKVPFSKAYSAKAATITLPAGVIVKDTIVQVVTHAGGSSIDVGLTSTDEDGFLDGESCATAGIHLHNMVDASAANNTLGALLVEADTTSADGTALYLSVKKEPGYLMAAAEAMSYQTSDHTVAGFIWVVISHPAFQVVGKAKETVDATGAAAAVAVGVLI